MPKVIALVEVHYAGIARVPGTPTAEFEASEPDAHILKAIGKVADAATVTPARRAPPVVEQAKQPEAETLFTPKADAAEDKPKRRYMRRDLRAEE